MISIFEFHTYVNVMFCYKKCCFKSKHSLEVIHTLHILVLTLNFFVLLEGRTWCACKVPNLVSNIPRQSVIKYLKILYLTLSPLISSCFSSLLY